MKKIAIITGASGGMGREIASLIARQRQLDEIWLIARRKDRMRDLSAELMIHARTRIFAMDLSKAESVAVLDRALRRRAYTVKWLVCAAGFGQIGRFDEIPFDAQMSMVDLNCRALTACTHLTLPYMKKGSRILLFSSAAAFLPQPDFAVYAATKSYVLSFARALSCELKGRGISVTAVCPGPVNTEFFDVAERTGKAKAYKKAFMSDCRMISKKIIKSAEKGKKVCVPTLSMKGVRLLSKLPHGIILSFFKKGE